MGHSYTPTYYARYRDQTGWNELTWEGRPTKARAEAKRRSLNESFLPGKINEQVSYSLGFIPHISRFQVVRNTPRKEVVVDVRAPMFEVV